MWSNEPFVNAVGVWTQLVDLAFTGAQRMYIRAKPDAGEGRMVAFSFRAPEPFPSSTFRRWRTYAPCVNAGAPSAQGPNERLMKCRRFVCPPSPFFHGAFSFFVSPMSCARSKDNTDDYVCFLCVFGPLELLPFSPTFGASLQCLLGGLPLRFAP